MNIQKAREYFSAYYEETLDSGLRQTLEREFAKDPALTAEYKAYCHAVEQINSLRNQVIDVPEDLHEQLSRRVDHALWEQKQTKKVGFFQNFWKFGLAGAAATVAIVGSVYALKLRAPSNFGGGTVNKVDPIELKMKDGDLTLAATPAQPEEVVTKDFETGQEISRIKLENKRLESPLSNENAGSRVIEISFTRESAHKLVVLPGRERSTTLEGTGTLVDLAKALSDISGTPVEFVSTPKTDRNVTWKLPGNSKADLMKLATDPAGVVTISVTDTGVILGEN